MKDNPQIAFRPVGDPVFDQPQLPPTKDQLQRMEAYAVATGVASPTSAFDCRYDAWCWLSECWDAEVRARGDFRRMPADLAVDWERRTQIVRASENPTRLTTLYRLAKAGANTRRPIKDSNHE